MYNDQPLLYVDAWEYNITQDRVIAFQKEIADKILDNILKDYELDNIFNIYKTEYF